MTPRLKTISTVESELCKVEFQDDHKEFDYPWHFHPEYELTYIQKGNGVRYVGNSVENFFNDDLIMVAGNLPHCWINAPEQGFSTQAIVIYLKQDFLSDTLMQSCEFTSIKKLLELSKRGVKFNKQLANDLKFKFINLANLPPFEKFISLLQILQTLAQADNYHCLCGHWFNHNLDITTNKRINIIHKFIQKNYQQKITLSQVASQINMSEVYFSRFFSKVMKKSFFEFLNEYRINKACKLLIETDNHVTEICYASGFESIPFFYRQFKKFKCSQPRAYRQNFRKASD